MSQLAERTGRARGSSPPRVEWHPTACAAAEAVQSRSHRSRERRRAAAHAPRPRRRARSPHRTARADPVFQVANSWAAPASPPVPPLVETSTIVRCVSRAANTRASSSSAAVAESSARAPLPAASRWAKMTIGLAPVEPGALRDHRRQRLLAVDRLRGEVPGVHLKAAARRPAQTAQRARDVCAERLIALAARATVRVGGGEARQFREGARAFESVRRERRMQRIWAPGEREGGDREGQHEGQKRRSVEATVEHL